MSKRVLSVGQCVPDQTTLVRFLEKHFDVTVEEAPLEQDALRMMRATHFDLVMINRKLDADYSDGVAIIRRIRQEQQWADTAVMLVSNYPDAQQQAVAEGAVYGIGKLQYDKPETVARVAEALGLQPAGA